MVINIKPRPFALALVATLLGCTPATQVPQSESDASTSHDRSANPDPRIDPPTAVARPVETAAENGIPTAGSETDAPSSPDATSNVFEGELDVPANAKMAGISEPSVKKVVLIERSKIKVTWEPVDHDAVAGYVVEIQISPNDELIPISPLLSPKTNSFVFEPTDIGLTGLEFRVTAVGAQNVPLVNSDPKYTEVMAQYPPPQPTGLKGKVVEGDERPVVLLEWDQKSDDDSFTYGFHVHEEDKNGKMFQIGKIGTTKDSECQLRIYNSRARGRATRRYGVSAMSSGGVKSEISTIELSIPFTGD